MSLSGREVRILAEIEDDLTATDPRLGRALASARLPVLRRSLTGSQPDVWACAAGLVVSLLFGIGVLAAGVVLDSAALVWAGVVTAEFAPATVVTVMGRPDRRLLPR